jgi:hypothetical protein
MPQAKQTIHVRAAAVTLTAESALPFGMLNGKVTL